MLNQERNPGSPKEWLSYAKSDLELARIAKSPNVMRELLCFHAQQAAEKALKAILIKENIDFPRTHNLRILLDKIPSKINLPAEIEDAVILTDYAVSIRYPGDMEDVTDADYHEALILARTVLDWVATIIKTK